MLLFFCFYHFLEARAKKCTKFCWFFGGWENLVFCFWYLLTFRNFPNAETRNEKQFDNWTFIRYQIQMDRTERSNFLGEKCSLLMVIQLCYDDFWSFFTRKSLNLYKSPSYFVKKTAMGSKIGTCSVFCHLFSFSDNVQTT